MDSSTIFLLLSCFSTRFHLQLPRLWLPCFLLTTQMFLSSLRIALAQTGNPPPDFSALFSPPPPDSFNTQVDNVTKSMSQAAVAGIVVSVLTVIFIGVGVIYCLFLVHKKTPERLQLPSINFGHPVSQYSNNQQSNSLNPPNSIAHNSEKHFTFEQVVTMTENFKFQLGRGGFGPVYYGKTSTGKEVAVKRLSSESDQGRPEFQTEVDILLRVHHKNLVSLIGYCSEFKELILIYEYMPGGTLDDHLHGREGARNPLDWETRIRIATDAANGLKYLHTDCVPRIIHRDVKGSNVLLDEKLTGKVSDFGLSKTFVKPFQTHVSTAVKGTVGYLDPEYANGLERLTDKSDVYSFGIVLLELLSGRKHILETPSGVQNISAWARPYILRDKFNEIVDPSLGDDYNMDALKQVAMVALSCVEFQGVARPSMAEVCGRLEEISKTYLKPRETIGAWNIDISSQMPSLESAQQSQAHKHQTMPLIWNNPFQDHQLPPTNYTH